jgi:hypothetical protein
VGEVGELPDAPPQADVEPKIVAMPSAKAKKVKESNRRNMP